MGRGLEQLPFPDLISSLISDIVHLYLGGTISWGRVDRTSVYQTILWDPSIVRDTPRFLQANDGMRSLL